MSLRISPLSKDQWFKVLKAAVYSFVSAAAVALVALNGEYSKQGLVVVAVAGLNAALVAIKQLFTDAEK